MSHAQVRTMKPDGSGVRWMGELGPVGGLHWGSTMPGGDDSMGCTLMRPPTYRTDAMDSGRIAQVVVGGSVAWDGKLDEGVPSASGWTLSAHGAGTFGSEWDAIYTTWSNQNDAVNQAITRGLRWTNAGIPSSVWLGQQIDSGSSTIADLLNLMCSKGALVWQVSSGTNILTVRAIPSTPTRLLVVTDPAPRTNTGNINAIAMHYQTSADGAAAATFATTFATNAASIAKLGRIEIYDDISSAGTLTAGAAQAVGTAQLARYVRASYGGPFAVHQGQLLTLGGQPVDIATEVAGEVVQLLVLDASYGGELSPTPVAFPVGACDYDEDSATLTLTPFASINLSLSGLLGAAALVNVPGDPTTGTAGFQQHPSFTKAQVAKAYGKHRARSERGKLFVGGKWYNVPR